MKQVAIFFFSLALFGGGPVQAETGQQKQGRELYEKILEEMPIYQDEKLVSYVQAVGDKLVAVTDHSDQPFTFTVIDDETVNAFALPGAYIFVHRGLIGYLNNEAELASVLAHEIAHVTENHHARRQGAATGSQLLAGVLGVLTGSYDVAEAGAIWGATVVSGFGREMELEADQVGAQYLYDAGYEPEAMIDVIALLKDNERLQKKKDQALGRKTPNYHGLFATHPRNDKRLRGVIAKVGKLPDAPDAEQNVTSFRLATEGMVWGRNYDAVELPDTVYQDEQRGFRFNIPEGWTFSQQGAALVGTPEDSEASLKITTRARTLESPDDYIRNQLNIPLIRKSEPLRLRRLKGHTGLVPRDGRADSRLAVIYYGRKAYIFEGEFPGEKVDKALDADMLAIIGSFRPVSRRALAARKSKVIHYVKATPSTTYAKLANYLKLGKFGEEELRIMNHQYPTGEPRPGQWIKIIRRKS